MNINSLLPQDANANQTAVSIQLEKKWERTGLLEGIGSEVERRGLAVLLENQAKQLVSEVNNTGTAQNSEEWAGVALPLVRRIFAEIAAKDFVSVQPMNLPSGLVFYLDFKYGTSTDGNQGVGYGSTTQGQGSKGGSVAGGDVTSLGGKTGANSPSGSSAPFGVGGLYGQGRYDYSINQVKVDVDKGGAISGDTTAGTFESASVTSYKDIDFNQEFSASLAASELVKLQFAKADFAGLDEKAIRSFDVSCTGLSQSLPQFTKINGANVEFIVSGASAAAVGTNASASIFYTKQPTESDRGDFEDTVGAGDTDSLKIPEVDLQLKSQAIVAKTRKLKAVWTPELAQDLNAYHSVDAEAELTSMLSEYISMEIDLEILDMLISDAQTTAYWSATPGEDYNGTGVNEAAWDITTFYGTRFEWFQTLVQKITTVSNEIHKLTLRGGANFVVVSPKVATILESLPGYNSTPGADASATQFAMGVSKVGAIDSRYTVYKNPYMTENTILVGFRGSNFLETGAVYSPYVPLIMTPLVYDPSDFTPRKGVMTRYAKKMIRPEFYGKVFCKDLHLV